MQFATKVEQGSGVGRGQGQAQGAGKLDACPFGLPLLLVKVAQIIQVVQVVIVLIVRQGHVDACSGTGLLKQDIPFPVPGRHSPVRMPLLPVDPVQMGDGLAGQTQAVLVLAAAPREKMIQRVRARAQGQFQQGIPAPLPAAEQAVHGLGPGDKVPAARFNPVCALVRARRAAAEAAAGDVGKEPQGRQKVVFRGLGKEVQAAPDVLLAPPKAVQGHESLKVRPALGRQRGGCSLQPGLLAGRALVADKALPEIVGRKARIRPLEAAKLLQPFAIGQAQIVLARMRQSRQQPERMLFSGTDLLFEFPAAQQSPVALFLATGVKLGEGRQAVQEGPGGVVAQKAAHFGKNHLCAHGGHKRLEGAEVQAPEHMGDCRRILPLEMGAQQRKDLVGDGKAPEGRAPEQVQDQFVQGIPAALAGMRKELLQNGFLFPG